MRVALNGTDIYTYVRIPQLERSVDVGYQLIALAHWYRTSVNFVEAMEGCAVTGIAR
jgi:hypothetical protein